MAERELYRIVTDDQGHLGIRCATCTHTSWNETDVKQGYCGHCHSFLTEEIGWPAERRDG